MYTAKLSLSPQNLEDVLAVANFLQMQEIVNACSAYQSMATPAVSLLTLDFDVGEFRKFIEFVSYFKSRNANPQCDFLCVCRRFLSIHFLIYIYKEAFVFHRLFDHFTFVLISLFVTSSF